jgi:spermidine synthase
MIEIDEMIVEASRKYIPEWSDCNDLVESSPWCIDDSRATLYSEDALAWFMDKSFHKEKHQELFNVIIMDAL